MTKYSQGVCEDGTAILRDGEPMTIEEILEALRASENLLHKMNNINNLNENYRNDKFYIWCLERNMFWKASRWGYTREITKAGVFSYSEACAIVTQANKTTIEECMIPLTALNSGDLND